MTNNYIVIIAARIAKKVNAFKVRYNMYRRLMPKVDVIHRVWWSL